MKKNIAYFFGGHKEDLSDGLDSHKQKEICILCDEPVYFTGNGRGIDGNAHEIDSTPAGMKKKYMATSCFLEVNNIFGTLVLREHITHMAMFNAADKNKGKPKN